MHVINSLADEGPGKLGNHEQSYTKERKRVTNPPLKAPTGLRTGGAAATASCSRRLELWNDLVGVEMGRVRERDEKAERRGKSLDAMLEVCDVCTCQSRVVLGGRIGLRLLS